MKRRLLAVLTVLAACSGGNRGGGTPPPGNGSNHAVGSGSAGDDMLPDPIDHDPNAGKPDEPPEIMVPPPAPTADRAPEVFPPAWKQVGIGQRISFSVAAIDQDLDETRVEVTAMPASAKFDPITQTVTWKPTRKDRPAGTFTLTISTLGADGAATATRDETWEIAVVKKKQPAPTPERKSAVIETLLTIREPARLAQVNRDWSFDKFLRRAAELQRAQMPPEAQKKLGKLDGKALFKSFLASLAQIHGNPRLDPAAREFDKKVFGDPRAWKIVSVRPRIDKKWTELRVVFQAVAAPEPVFAMFRVRPTWDVPTLPAEARAYNNKVFLELVSKHLLDGGKASEAHLGNARKHGKAVAALVNDVLRHDDSATHPWARAAFLALPTEGRMGGGSRRNDDGSYRSGDGWAWSVMKPMPNAEGTALAYVNVGIPGFWTHTVPSPDGTAWIGKCAPKFDPDDPTHAPGYEVLCRKEKGFVDLPDLVDGKVASSKKDAINLFVEHKKVMVATLALDDGRRDHGEENGMTCAQCHMRNFGVRDYRDAATADPRQGTPKNPNASLPTLDFQIIPAASWPAFTLAIMMDQECKGAAQIKQFLGVESGLTCPLAP